MTDDVGKIAAEVVSALTDANKNVASAESCTGGWIAKALTDAPGSSAAFGFGFVTYSNAAKEKLLGVRHETLTAYGAVSETVVAEMARGALDTSGADVAVAVSGIAGPDGGTPDKPVGTVWFAWAVRDGSNVRVTTDRQCFEGDRDDVRRQSVVHALGRIRATLPK